jgi:hypothetical protein
MQRPSMSAQSLLTVFLLMPSRAIACTRFRRGSGGDTADPDLLDHGHERLFAGVRASKKGGK